MSRPSSLVSLSRKATPLERMQATAFVGAAPSGKPQTFRLWRASTTAGELEATVARYLGAARARRAFESFLRERGRDSRRRGGRRASDPPRRASAVAGDRRLDLAPRAVAAAAAARHVGQVGAEAARRRLGGDPVEPRPIAACARSRPPGHHRVRQQSRADLLEPRIRRPVRSAGGDAAARRRARRDRPLQRRARRLRAGAHPTISSPSGSRACSTTTSRSRLRLFIRRRACSRSARRACPTAASSPPTPTSPRRCRPKRSSPRPTSGWSGACANAPPNSNGSTASWRAPRPRRKSANLSKTRFLAAASHDILQPLNAARLYASSLSEVAAAGADGGARRSWRAMSTLRSRRSRKSCRALLDISRLDAGATRPQIADFAIDDVFRQLEIEFAPTARAKGLTLRFVPSSLVVRSDRRLMRRLLQNLVSNALKYTPKGRVVVGCRRRRRSGAHRGVGHRPRHSRRPAAAGVRGIPAARPGGAGRRAASASACRSSSGSGACSATRSACARGQARGSVFSVVAPRGAAGAARAAEPRRAEPHGRRRRAARPARAGDRQRAARARRHARAAEQMGLQVAIARDLREARAALATLGGPPDAIVADYHLDEGDGCRAIAALRQQLGERTPGDSRHRRPQPGSARRRRPRRRRAAQQAAEARPAARAVAQVPGAARGGGVGERRLSRMAGLDPAIQAERIKTARGSATRAAGSALGWPGQARP